VFCEIVVSASCLYQVGRRAVDRRTISATLKSVVIAAGVIVLDHLLRPMGSLRIAIDMIVYAIAALATGAVRSKEAASVLRLLRERRREGTA
jgi:hypothetical protein